MKPSLRRWAGLMAAALAGLLLALPAGAAPVKTENARAELVADVGLLRRDSDGELARKLDAVAASVARREDLAAFEAKVHDAGAWLKTMCPPRADDVNELPDAPDVA